jgi:hypothetical protein
MFLTTLVATQGTQVVFRNYFNIENLGTGIGSSFFLYRTTPKKYGWQMA